MLQQGDDDVRSFFVCEILLLAFHHMPSLIIIQTFVGVIGAIIVIYLHG